MELPGASLGPTSAQALVQMLLAEEQQPCLVNLEGNELGDKGAVCLAELVRHSRELVWLDLGSNGIGPVGGVALAEALATSPSLTALDLSSSPSTCRHRNVLGRKVRDGEEPLQAAPSADPLEGGLRQRGRPRSASEEALSHEECKLACERHYEAEHWFPIRRGAPVEPVADDADAGAGEARAAAPPPLGSAPAAHHRHAHHKHAHHHRPHARGSPRPAAEAPPAARAGCVVGHSAHATPLRWLYGALSVDVLLIALVLGFALALVVA